MADRPILFSAPMVRALLAGTKTQTRRVAPIASTTSSVDWRKTPYPGFYRTDQFGDLDFVPVRIPIKVGDRLYVRERWAPLAGGNIVPIAEATYSMTVDGAHQHKDGRYQPGLERYADGAFDRIKWRPGIHQPRWASRLTLHVTEVRVQRLQDISDDDAAAEGLTYLSEGPGAGHWIVDDTPVCSSGSAEAYAQLWEHINGAGAWAKNPWVAAYTFTVEKSNIDGAA